MKKKSLKPIGITLALLIVGLLLLWSIVALKKDTPQAPDQILVIGKVVAMFIGVFVIAILGELLGAVSIKGISLGSAGAFLVAILFGFLFTIIPAEWPIIGSFHIDATAEALKDLSNTGYWYANIIQNVGLILFISAVGFIAGPTFFRSFQQNAKAYIVLAIVVSLIGQLMAVGISIIPNVGNNFAAGIFAGALTSTPAYSAALDAALNPAMVTLGYAITYPFGVIGVVLFIQLTPRLMHANMDEERAKIKVDVKGDKTARVVDLQGMYRFDPYGLFPMFLAIVAGLLVGAISIPLTAQGYQGPCFSLGTTGGVLFSCLLLGHFGHFGKVSLQVHEMTNKTFREFGLLLFLIGAGVNGGLNLVSGIQSAGGVNVVFIALGTGAVITVAPAIIGFFIAKNVLKLPLLNNLGSITGSMTSTPALASLINMAKTDDVASAYAVAFPLATILTTITNNIFVTIGQI